MFGLIGIDPIYMRARESNAVRPRSRPPEGCRGQKRLAIRALPVLVGRVVGSYKCLFKNFEVSIK